MLLSRPLRLSAVASLVGGAAMALGMLCGGAPTAFAQPAPGCTAADLAQASGTVGTAMSDYLFSHPDVNSFFTSLRGQPNEEIRGDVQNYLNANPGVESDINAIRQPVADLRNRCQ